MTARLAGFVTRADAGLRAPKSFSRRITPGQGGVAIHYGGPALHLRDHAGCVRTWRAWQTFHMDGHGWADIAYTMGVCDHGYALAGRGAGVRTAAQGTNAGNDDYYAVVWLGGGAEVPSLAALDALEWCVAELRTHAGAGDKVRPHKSFHSTDCPGVTLTRKAKAMDGVRVITGDRWLGLHDPLDRDQRGNHDVSAAQHALVVAGFLTEDQVDGIYGRDTADATNALHARYQVPERGWGPLTWALARQLVHGGAR